MGCGNSNLIQEPRKTEKDKTFTITASDLVNEKYGKISKDYVLLLPPIGKGAFGEVRKAVHRITEEMRAVKIISKLRTNKDYIEKLKLEVEIMKQLDHPNILKVYEYYQDSQYFYIITELCTGGELFDKIAHQKHFSERKAAITMQQILTAINYCHSHSIVHRDLKPENILYEENTQDSLIKIVDFGSSRYIHQNMTQKLGTPYYMAPEVVDRSYDEKCDIWSCGVIMYILLSGYPPFRGQNEKEILDKVQTGRYSLASEEWQIISDEAKSMIMKMLVKELIDPQKRYSAQQAVNDQWIQKYVQRNEIEGPILGKALKNMKNFRADTKLQEAVWVFIVNNMVSREEKSELLKSFRALDLNNDGILSKQELIAGYQKYMPYEEAEEEVERIMIQVDKNNSKGIDYTEFVMATMNREILLEKQRLEKTFRLFDQDHSGYLSCQEIRNILGPKVDDQVWKELIKEVDENGDGEVQSIKQGVQTHDGKNSLK